MDRAQLESSRYLVIVVDDLGRTHSVNAAVARAYEWGLFRAVSLMAGGEAFDEAVAMIRQWPALSAGLHVTLCDGRSVLPHSLIPDLVDLEGCFEKSPLAAGLRYWRFRETLAPQIAAEVEAQFGRMEKAGIRPTHVDCHHHLHMHPVVFDIVARECARRGVSWIRVPREPLSLILKAHFPLLEPLALFNWLIFGVLSERNLRVAHAHGLRAVNNVYGLSGTGRIDEAYVLALLPRLAGVTNELYLHPDMATAAGRREMKVVTSNRVRDRIARLGVLLTGFRELTGSTVDLKRGGNTAMGGR